MSHAVHALQEPTSAAGITPAPVSSAPEHQQSPSGTGRSQQVSGLTAIAAPHSAMSAEQASIGWIAIVHMASHAGLDASMKHLSVYHGWRMLAQGQALC